MGRLSDIVWIAERMLEQHGARTAALLEDWAEENGEAGEVEGMKLWRDVARAVRELEAAQR